MEICVEVPEKIKKIELPCDLVIPLRSTYPKELKPESGRYICTSEFTLPFFTTAKIWKQPECLSAD